MMDTFNHGTWNLPFGPYVLHVGVKTGVSNGKPVITPIGEFDAPNDTYGLQLVFDCNTRGTRRIRGQVYKSYSQGYFLSDFILSSW